MNYLPSEISNDGFENPVKKKIAEKVDIFCYTNLQQYLNDYKMAGNAETGGYSYQSMADKIGVHKSRIFQVFKGSHQIKQKILRKNFADFFCINEKQKKYFQELINQYNDSLKGERAPYEYLSKLAKLGAKFLSAEEAEYCREWYYVAIAELLVTVSFNGRNYSVITNSLHPKITHSQAVKAVAVLKKLNIIQKNRKGIYKKNEHFRRINVNRDIDSALTARYFETMAAMYKNMVLLPIHQRKLKAMTISISAENYSDICEKIDKLSVYIARLSQKTKNTDRVYQVNFQFFPLSQLPEKEL